MQKVHKNMFFIYVELIYSFQLKWSTGIALAVVVNTEVRFRVITLCTYYWSNTSFPPSEHQCIEPKIYDWIEKISALSMTEIRFEN